MLEQPAGFSKRLNFAQYPVVRQVVSVGFIYHKALEILLARGSLVPVCTVFFVFVYEAQMV